jgi:hypothetical protein
VRKASVAAVALAIMLLAWQNVSLQPAAGLDQSWIAGLSMAVHNGISFGDHAIFTYGPLGFLTVASDWYGGLGAASFAYLILIRLALAAVLFVGLRRTFGGLVAFVIAVVVVQPAFHQAETVIVLVGLVLVITGELSELQLTAVAAAAGGFAGFELLAKLSVFPSLAAMTAIFVLTARGRRRACAVAALLGAVCAFLVGWFVSGQPLSALPSYVGNSIQIASGYSSAMSNAVSGEAWQGAAAVVAYAFGLWGALHMTETANTRQRWGIVLLWSAFWFFAFKEGFVRHDQGHATVFFGATVGGFAAFRWRWTHRIPALACASALVTFGLGASGQSFGSLIHPVSSARNAVRQTGDVLSPDSVIAAGREQIRRIEPIDARSLALLAGRSTAPYPTDLVLAWAYRLKWDPVPVLQSYSAYTSKLDNVDANFVRSSRAPQRILLHHEEGIDSRAPWFDQGETSRTILCRYRQARAQGIFAVLGLSSNRCLAPTPLRIVHADWAQAVQVPSPPDSHSLVFVRIQGVNVSGFERLRAAFYKPAERFVTLNDSRFRLVEGTASDGLPLLASAGYDYSVPFNFAPGANTISVSKQGQSATGKQPITFAFYVQPFSQPAQAALSR